MGHSIRQTFSLSSETVDNLDKIAKHLGVSKSALTNELLGQATGDILRIIDQLPAGKSTNENKLRLRGASIDVIESRLSDLNDQVADLKSRD